VGTNLEACQQCDLIIFVWHTLFAALNTVSVLPKGFSLWKLKKILNRNLEETRLTT
jgi:hypothetical protein